MSTAPQRFPLAWPAHKARTRAQDRVRGIFVAGGKKITLAGAADKLEEQIERLGGVYAVLSTNYELRMDGRPRADRAAPADPGVCVYFQLKSEPYAMACDRFNDAAQNIAAIANHIDTLRRQERYGVATAAENLQAFQALPAPARERPRRPWAEVFGVMVGQADEETIRALYRVKAKQVASDEAALTELNLARDEALAALKAQKVIAG